MIRRSRKLRRGVVAVESALAYSILIPLVASSIVAGLGVFRYQQLNHIACESVRWASVRGMTYQGEAGKTAPTTFDMLRFASSKAVGMGRLEAGEQNPRKDVLENLDGSLLMSSDTATVTLQYQWVPETSIFPSMTFTATAAAPITY